MSISVALGREIRPSVSVSHTWDLGYMCKDTDWSRIIPVLLSAKDLLFSFSLLSQIQSRGERPCSWSRIPELVLFQPAPRRSPLSLPVWRTGPHLVLEPRDEVGGISNTRGVGGEDGGIDVRSREQRVGSVESGSCRRTHKDVMKRTQVTEQLRTSQANSLTQLVRGKCSVFYLNGKKSTNNNSVTNYLHLYGI